MRFSPTRKRIVTSPPPDRRDEGQPDTGDRRCDGERCCPFPVRLLPGLLPRLGERDPFIARIHSPVLSASRRPPTPRKGAGARIRTWELLREQILSLPPLAARPPRLRQLDERGDLILLPTLRPLGRPRPRRAPARLPLPVGLPACRRRPGTSDPVGTAPAIPGGAGHIAGTSLPGDLLASGFGRSGPRPRTRSSHGSRAPGTRGGAGRCTASRSAAPARRTGRPVRAEVPGLRVPPGRTGRRPDSGRSGPSRRCAAPSDRCVSGLGLLTYGTIDRDAADDRSAPHTVFSRRRRGDRSHGSRDHRGDHSVSRRRVDGRIDHRGVGRGRRRGRDDRGRRAGRRGPGRRGPRGRGWSSGWRRGGSLGQRVATLLAEEGTFVCDLPAV